MLCWVAILKMENKTQVTYVIFVREKTLGCAAHRLVSASVSSTGNFSSDVQIRWASLFPAINFCIQLLSVQEAVLPPRSEDESTPYSRIRVSVSSPVRSTDSENNVIHRTAITARMILHRVLRNLRKYPKQEVEWTWRAMMVNGVVETPTVISSEEEEHVSLIAFLPWLHWTQEQMLCSICRMSCYIHTVRSFMWWCGV